MFQKINEFFHPNRITITILLVFLFAMPVLYVYSEPERTNYSPGEKQHRVIKTMVNESVLSEYLMHTDGNIDVLLGIIERDYVSNHVGTLLVVINYIIACGIKRVLHTLRRGSG